MKKSFFISCALSALTFQNAYALVDYSDSTGGSSSESKSMQKISKPSSTQAPSGSGRALAWKSDLSFTTNYESIEVDSNKYGVWNANLHLQTPVNIYFDASYWRASGDEGASSGNPKLILGFNWLRFGPPAEEARLDLYGGARLSSSSKLGTSRTDKIIGVETSKRFGTFGLSVGYDMTLVGTPSRSDEIAIGNIGRISVSGGWMVSQDIQFEVEAENFSINKSSDTGRSHLAEKVSFSTLSPKVNLGLAPAVNLELGARFRMKKAKEEARLMSAGVFDLHGANSNSLFAGLNITI